MHFARRSRRGAMLVLIAVVMVILLVGAVFSVDVAYMHMVRAELRTATDAAARAGSEALARTQDLDVARAAAIATAARNRVAGSGLLLADSDVVLGGMQAKKDGRFGFVPDKGPFTAIRVVGRRDAGSRGGPVPLFFARVFSTSQFEPVLEATAAANVRDIALVLDVSGSMASGSGSGTRLSALQEAVEIFLDEVKVSSPRSLISLTTYSTTPKKEVSLTSDLDKIRSKVERFRASGMTAIGNALTMGSDSLSHDGNARSFAAKTIILMTDGNHNTGPSPLTTVATAVARGQQVHTITFSSGANQGLMRSVAAATPGGIHIHADDADDLSVAFRDIARSLSVVLID